MLLLAAPPARAQRPSARADSLQRLLATSRPDTNRVEYLIQLAWDRTDDNPLAAIGYGRQSLALARELRFATGECRALLMLGWAFMRAGNYPTAVQTQLQARRLAERVGFAGGIIHADNAIGYAYSEQGNYPAALRYYQRAIALARQRRDNVLLTPILGNIGQAWLNLGRPDSARRYLREGYAFDLRFRDRHSEIGDLSLLGDVEAGSGHAAAARAYYRQTIERARGMPVSYALCRAYLGLARLAGAARQPAQALAYGREALGASRRGGYAKGVFEASGYLAEVYRAQNDYPTAYRYLAAAGATRDSLFSQVKVAQLQALAFGEQMHQQELADQRLSAAAARRQRLLLAGLVALAGAAGLTYLLLNRRRLRREVEFAQERQLLERLRAQAVLAAEEAERRRIGADLHDGVGQLLTAAKLNLHALAEELREDTPAGPQRLLAHALDVVDESFREVRSISHNLLPNALIRRGLGQAVGDFTSKIAPGGRPRFQLEVIGLDENHRLEPALESVVFRIIQELVQNIVKHARASEVTVQLLRRSGELCVLVTDNGVGFDPTTLGEDVGIGLKNIESRLMYLGGRVDFDSRPGRGTTVTIEVPLPSAAPEEIINAGRPPVPTELLARVSSPNLL